MDKVQAPLPALEGDIFRRYPVCFDRQIGADFCIAENLCSDRLPSPNEAKPEKTECEQSYRARLQHALGGNGETANALASEVQVQNMSGQVGQDEWVGELGGDWRNANAYRNSACFRIPRHSWAKIC